MHHLLIAVLIFTVSFILIVSEKIPAVWTAMLGGMLMVLTGIIDEHMAFEALFENLEIVFLLFGMMIIVNVLSDTGIFQWFAIKIAQVVKGDPFGIIALLALVTTIFSAFLDNVTTILLMVPVSIFIADQLELDPLPFIMTEVFSANIGGSATLIGDPPNLIIASASGLGFNSFLINLAPVSMINLVLLILIMYLLFCRKMKVSRDLKAKILDMKPSRSLKNKKDLIKALAIFSLVIFGFLTDNLFHKGLAVISVSGAMLLSIITYSDPHKSLIKVEWDTLFFFMGLFILVKGIEEVKLIEIIGEKIINLTQGNMALMEMFILWFSAISTSFMGNVPYTVTFSKIIHVLSSNFPGLSVDTFWWALSLGACLGGNITIVASAANIVAVSASGKAGRKISFSEFLKYGVLIGTLSMIVSSVYLIIRY